MVERSVLPTVSALAILSFVLGSVHAFSVLAAPLADAFGASRAAVSLTYSIALVSITTAVTLGPQFYARLPAWQLVGCIVALGSAGAVLAGLAGDLWLVWIGYGVIFGLANGAGYGYALQLSAQIASGREGLAMGIITSAYAVGATVFPFVFDLALSAYGFPGAMGWLAVSLVSIGAASAGALRRSGARFVASTPRPTDAPLPDGVLWLWLSYLCAVAAGLMIIGHAVGVSEFFGVAPHLLVFAPVFVALFNMVGSLIGGLLADHVPARRLRIGLPLLSSLALLGVVTGLPLNVLLALGLVGFVYGAVISTYPAVIARRFGVVVGARVYGRVFTGWAVAGLGGPVLAGVLFDRTASYDLALLIAAALGIVSAAISAVQPFSGNAR